MGFGYLLIGYVVTYLISITAGAVGVGSVTLLIGAALMFWGLRGLCRFDSAFAPAKWLTVAVFALGLLRLWQDFFSDRFVTDASVNEAFAAALTWASFVITVLFHMAMLYGIRVLALQVELKKHASHAMYNTFGVGIWGALFLLCNMPALGEDLLPYLGISMTLFNLVYLISDIALLLRCLKDICAEGDEEVAPKRSRFAWINRIADSYSQTMDKLKENSRADGDAFWSERMKKDEAKKNTNKNHKKRKKK